MIVIKKNSNKEDIGNHVEYIMHYRDDKHK